MDNVISVEEIQPVEKPRRRPEWLKVRAPQGEAYDELKRLMRVKTLHTVCEEALCPNIGECWGRGTATFLMMGDVCTRSCAFCDIKTGRPAPMDWDEPNRVAQAIKAMNLRHAVITSVNRDERKDGGAPIFAMVIQRIREVQPGCTIEVLIPDFKGNVDALKMVTDAAPEILNHNVETVPRLFKQVQPQDNYEWAMATLGNAKQLSPPSGHKERHHAGPGRDHRRSRRRDARSGRSEGGHPDAGAISAAEQAAPADRSLCAAGRIRRVETDRT